jgi:hypothetical protein
MATTTPTFARKSRGKHSASADVWSLVANYHTGRPEDELDRRARDLATIHRPDRHSLHWTFRWGVPWALLHYPACVFCGRRWLCPPAAWAYARLSMLGAFQSEHPREDQP